MKKLSIYIGMFLALSHPIYSQVTPGSIIDETIDNYLATPADGHLKTVPVVVLRYLPTVDGINIDVSKSPDYYDLGYITLNQLKANIDKYLAGLKFSLEEGSKFHGYKDPAAVPYLGYKVLKFWTIYDQVPISTSYQLSTEQGFPVFEPDFIQIYNDFGLQQYIETNGVEEIWIWFGGLDAGLPSYDPEIHFPENFVAGPESNMASPVTGDISNSARFPNDIPIASKTAVVYCYNFRRTQAEAVHNHGHQLESIYKYAAAQQDGNENIFVHDFCGWGINYSSPPLGRVGDCHHPPNMTIEYQYLNPTLVESDIEDWEPAVGPKKWVNVNTWANLNYSWPAGYIFPQLTESQWYIYWMQNMPGYGSSIPYNSNYMTNWWQFTSDWDSCITHNVGLYAPTHGQVAINTDNASPNGSAMLDVKASDRGLLIPRISTVVRNQIPSPATGLLIYNSTTNQLNYFNGSSWVQLESDFITSTVGTISQVGGISINNSPNASPSNAAMLDIDNPSRGILIPRTTPNSITAPATGLIIYNTDAKLLSYFNGSQWTTLCANSTGVSGATGSQSSVGVSINAGRSIPHHSSALDLTAVNMGILIPRLTNAQRDAIHPVLGLIIYNVSGNDIEFYNGSAWYRLVANSLESPTAGVHVPSLSQIIWKWNTVSGATGYKWNTTNDYASATNMGTSTTKTETGLTSGTSYARYVWAYSTCSSAPLTLTQVTSVCPCASYPTITYGGKTYNTVQIGSQCWFRENLNIGSRINGNQNQTNNQIIEKYCYLDNEANCNVYGGLYQWAEVVQYLNGATNTTSWNPAPAGNVQGICPMGWHLPTDIELAYLTTFLGESAGGKMKEKGTTHWNSPNSGATNLSGFTGLPGGDRSTNGCFYSLATHGNFWSASENSAIESWARHLGFDYENVARYGEGKTSGFSVRCLKDTIFAPTTITTSSVSDITQTSAAGGGNITSDGGAAVTARGVCWSTSSNPTTVNNHTNVGGGNGAFVSSIIGLNPHTQYFVKAYATNNTGTVYGNEVSFTTLSLWSCGQAITDLRNGKTYQTVQIGNQCWMAENLNLGFRINGSINQENNSTVEKYCSLDNESNCDVYGGLYQWSEAVQYLNGATNTTSWSPAPTGNVQGVCPTGWHLPNDSELTALTSFLGGINVAGGRMKETGTTHWALPNTGATNSSGFTGLPGGDRSTNSCFYSLTTRGSFWSATENSATKAWERHLGFNYESVARYGEDKTYGFSVRCIKN